MTKLDGDPPLPVAESVKVVVLKRAPVLTLPPVGLRVLLTKGEILTDVQFGVDQDNVDELPEVIDDGEEEKELMTQGLDWVWVTEMVVCAEGEPFGPDAVIVYVVVFERAPVETLPLATDRLFPTNGEIETLVQFVVDQERVAELPEATWLGEALNELIVQACCCCAYATE